MRIGVMKLLARIKAYFANTPMDVQEVDNR